MGVYWYVWGKLVELKEYLVFAYEKEKDWIAWEYVNNICLIALQWVNLMLFRIELLSAGFRKQPIKYDSPWITYFREASSQRKKVH